RSFVSKSIFSSPSLVTPSPPYSTTHLLLHRLSKNGCQIRTTCASLACKNTISVSAGKLVLFAMLSQSAGVVVSPANSQTWAFPSQRSLPISATNASRLSRQSTTRTFITPPCLEKQQLICIVRNILF